MPAVSTPSPHPLPHALPTARVQLRVRWWGVRVLIDAAILEQWRRFGVAFDQVRLRTPGAATLRAPVAARPAIGATVAVPWWRLVWARCRPGAVALMRPSVERP